MPRVAPPTYLEEVVMATQQDPPIVVSGGNGDSVQESLLPIAGGPTPWEPILPMDPITSGNG